jgi:hypothetical protein
LDDLGINGRILLLHVHPLLGNGLVNKFPRRQILGKQSVARSRNNRTKLVVRQQSALQWTGEIAIT